ncbi:flavodoxin domain-containing protein, partial [Rhizobiaceae bacterium]|nr:flavodoxin domain-containing protein [Rhizobiaceae bacterium]
AANLNGFDADMATLDTHTGKLPTDGVVLITCASYNGTPPDNARGFVDWLKGAEAGTLDGVNYALFGCGHSDWAATFQATPREIDEHMQRAGASAVVSRAEANAKDDLDEQFEGWLAPLWPAVGEKLGLDVDFSQAVEAQALYGIEFLDADVSNPLIEQMGAQPVTVSVNRELQTGADGAAPERSTRHIEVVLAPGQSYAPGDHLSIVPRNPTDLVRRVEARFGLRATGFVKLSSDNGAHAALPVGRPVSLRDLLFSMVELQSPASRRDVALMAQHTRCPKTKPELERLAGADHAAEIGEGRVSVLDLLERFPACEMPFEVFLETCPNMVPRYYSISSSPKEDPTKCSITVAVVQGPSRSDGHRYEGVCSTYLAQQEVGAGLHAATRAPSAGFTLPDDSDTPIIMIGPGTGLAPFRGFCQEREATGAKGEALLFFGCRHPDQDFLYADELKAWHEAGVIELHTAFSRAGKSRVYVQDVIREQRERVWALLEAGAKVFVCGDGGRMEPDVRRTLGRIAAEELDLDEAAGEAWMDRLAKEGRYALDVWVGE